MKETGFTGSFPEFLKYLKNEKKFYMDNKVKHRQEQLMAVFVALVTHDFITILG